jgi:hypothetical protein
MITAIRFRRRRADLPSRWSSTACDDTHSNAPFYHQSEPAMATLDGHLNCQHLPLPPTRCIIARPRAHCDPPTHLPRQPIPHSGVARRFPRTVSRGFVPWRLSDAGHCPLGTIVHGRHPKPSTQAAVPGSRMRQAPSTAESDMLGISSFFGAGPGTAIVCRLVC